MFKCFLFLIMMIYFIYGNNIVVIPFHKKYKIEETFNYTEAIQILELNPFITSISIGTPSQNLILQLDFYHEYSYNDNEGCIIIGNKPKDLREYKNS
ncbi:MAG: hypothetical protein MJ252_25980, partial [archaeon]|nr:hypothetical protein [archaeon]